MTGDELKEWRKSLALTQLDLASALGIDVSTLKRAESAAEIPRMMELALDAAASTIDKPTTITGTVPAYTAKRVADFADHMNTDFDTVLNFAIDQTLQKPLLAVAQFSLWKKRRQSGESMVAFGTIPPEIAEMDD